MDLELVNQGRETVVKVSSRRLLGVAIALAITVGVGFASPATAQDAALGSISPPAAPFSW